MNNNEEILQEAIDIINANSDNDDYSKVKTGLQTLDNMFFRGYQQNETIVISGESGSGKTSLLTNIFINSTLENNIPGLFVSLEMEKTSIVQNIIAALNKIRIIDVRKGNLSDEEWEKIATTLLDNFDNDGFRQSVIIDEPYTTLKDIDQILQENQQLSYVLLDSIHSVYSDNSYNSREEELYYQIKELKKLSIKHKVPIFITAHVNKNNDGESKRRNDEPLFDIKGSNSIHNFADIVLNMNRLDLHDREHYRAGEIDITIMKSRFTPTGIIRIFHSMHNGNLYDFGPDFKTEYEKKQNAEPVINFLDDLFNPDIS